MGVYYRVAAKCDCCKSRTQLDTNCYSEFEVVEKALLEGGCYSCESEVQVFKTISTVDWSCLDQPHWSR
jgi:hypothetical protein